MYQSFDDQSEPEESSARLRALRTVLERRGADGLILPRTDEYQGEYLAAYAERLAWLTGFTGSAGLCIILKKKAVLFVDERYTIQAREQTDPEVIEVRSITASPPAKWLAGEVVTGTVIGFDPWLMTPEQLRSYKNRLTPLEASLKPLERNPVDEVWPAQPLAPNLPVNGHPLEYAGQAVSAKLDELQAKLRAAKIAATVLSAADSVAWLFNIRGQDVAHTPVAHARAIVPAEGKAVIVLDETRIADHLKSELDETTAILPPAKFDKALATISVDKARVLVDPQSTPVAIVDQLEKAGAQVVNGRDPCVLPRARKNAVELEGARKANKRDGLAVTRFLAWLDLYGSGANIDEISAAEKLEEIRREDALLREISFDTISAVGAHAALPHYRVTRKSVAELRRGNIYLVDSGGQYLDGTTDITRTIIIGNPTAEMRDRFTRVLQGMINLSLARFPAGTTGGNLDMLARRALWNAGLDYDHGTGHGVGSYLSVHEGPARFSKTDKTILEAGMILSNEPGYYKKDHFGIRIENLVAVRKAEPIKSGERPMLWLETLTLAPIDRNLIEINLLTDIERRWLNAYHKRVLEEIGPELEQKPFRWLQKATAPL